MKHEQVPINKIIIPETRVTAVYDEELTELLHTTIKALGVLQPVVLVKTADGYHLVDGLHRLQETMQAGESVMDAVVYEGEAKEALLMNLVLNRVRGKTRASELVKVISALFSEYGLDPDAIKEQTGLSRDYIEKLIKIGRAAPGVLELLDEEIIGVGVAFEVSRLPALEQQEEVCAKARIWKYSVREMKEFVDEVLSLMAEAPPEPVTPRQAVEVIYKCEGCQAAIDPRWLRPVNLCPNCFGEVWKLGKQGKEPEAEKSANSDQGEGG